MTDRIQDTDQEVLAAIYALRAAAARAGVPVVVRVESRLGPRSYVHVFGGTASVDVDDQRWGVDVLATLGAMTAEYAARAAPK